MDDTQQLPNVRRGFRQVAVVRGTVWRLVWSDGNLYAITEFGVTRVFEEPGAGENDGSSRPS